MSSAPPPNPPTTSTSMPSVPGIEDEPVLPGLVENIQVLDDLSGELQALAKQHSQANDFLRSAMRLICARHRLLAFNARARCGIHPYQDSAHANNLSAGKIHGVRDAISACQIATQGEQGIFLSPTQTLDDLEFRVLCQVMTPDTDNGLIGTLAFAVPNSSQGEDSDAERIGDLRISVAQAIAAIPHHAGSRDGSATESDNRLEMAARVSKYESVREFAFALVNSLASRFRCQQVALGLANGSHVAVQAVSGKDSFKSSSPGIVDIQQAMEECLDQQETVVFNPNQTPTLRKTFPVHSQWGSTTRTAVCSIPILCEEKCIAIVSLRKDAQTGFSDQELAELESLIQPFGAAIELAKRGEQGLPAHVRSSASELATRVRNPQTTVGKWVRIGLIVAAIVFLFGWLPYRPSAPCAIVAANLTQTLAPFDMQLSSVHIRSGDRVTKGQLLAEFDTRELEFERSRLQALLGQAEVDVRTALLERDPAAASLAKANSAVYQRQLDTVNYKIALCSLTAPCDGMIVEADLQDKVGQSFAQGSPILSFSPMKEFELEIRVPEAYARHVAPEQTGSFVSSATPGRSYSYEITSVSGSAELVNGTNVVVAHAKLHDASSSIFRQGMEGFASTHTGWRPIPWIAFHRVYEYACSNFWF